jgi:dTDP-4-dehydrorhamnose 3,5-epimerase
MRFLSTNLSGVMILEAERHPDPRGYFARTWCARELAEHGLDPSLSQCSVSFNHRRGTLRGLHYQIPPHAEVKLVRCIRGALFDVAVDLRPDSTTFGRHHGAELSAANGRALYIPRGFAHGFYTLADATEVEYFIGTPYQPEAARGVRYDDPLLGISWPGPVEVIASRDAEYPPARREHFEPLRGLLEHRAS